MIESTALTLATPTMPQRVEIGQEWFQSRDKILSITKQIDTITCQDDFDNAEIALKKITKTSNNAEDLRKKAGKPFADFASKIKEMADTAREPLEEEKARIKAIMAEYLTAQEKKRIEEIETKAVALVDDPFAECREVKVDTQIVQKTMSTARTVYKFEIVEPGMVPCELCSPDPKKIREYIDSNKEAAHIPGVRVWSELDVRAR